jgi:hypothetical protein
MAAPYIFSHPSSPFSPITYNLPMSHVYASYLAAATTGQLHMMKHIFEEVLTTLTSTYTDPPHPFFAAPTYTNILHPTLSAAR